MAVLDFHHVCRFVLSLPICQLTRTLLSFSLTDTLDIQVEEESDSEGPEAISAPKKSDKELSEGKRQVSLFRLSP